MKHKAKKIEAGEYEYRGFNISQCNEGNRNWFIRITDEMAMSGFNNYYGTLAWAKQAIDNYLDN